MTLPGIVRLANFSVVAPLTLSANAWWYVLAALAALVGAFLVYRYTLPPVSRLRRTILWCLRGLALVSLILLLFEPVLNYVRRSNKRPVLAVLLDRSASMGVASGADNRPDELKRLLQSAQMTNLPGKFGMRAFIFADSLTEVPFDSLRHASSSGVGTDLAGSWAGAERVLASENLAAILLISDGAYNLGENPGRAAAGSPIPIFAIGVGDTSGHADAAIAEMLTNDVTYAGSHVPIDVHVRAHGLAGKSSVLHLLRAGGGEIGRQVVRFEGDDSEQSVQLAFDANEPGDIRVTAALDSVPGESMTENNRRSVIIRVLERKSRVFLFSGSPSPDLTILRQTLESDTTIEVSSNVERIGGGYLNGIPEPADEDLQKASLIILMDLPTRGTTQSLLDKVTRAATDKRIPVMYFAGPRVVPSRFSALSSFLPIQSSRPSLVEEPVTCRAAASHPALVGRTPLPAEWSDLPPIFGGAGDFTVAPNAVVTAKLSREALGVSEDEPGMVIWDSGALRGAAFLCWGTSRWKLQLAGNPNGAAFYDQLMARVRSWLIAPAEEQRVKIRTTKKLYSGGESVRFTAQVYGADLAPRDDATINLRATSGSRTEAVAMRNRGNGRYEGELLPWAEGDYRFAGSAFVDKDTLGSDHGLFAVEAFNVELVDTRARYDVMRQVADASKGAFAPVSRADSLISSLRFPPKQISTRMEIPLWNRGPLIWIVILLLALEWIIRKRSGML